MNIKILTCLLVVVAYSEAGAIPPRFKDDFSMGKPVGDSEEATLSPRGREMSDGSDTQRQAPLTPPSRYPPPVLARYPPPGMTLREYRQSKIIETVGNDLVPFIFDCARHLNARHVGLTPPQKTTSFGLGMLNALDHPRKMHEVRFPLQDQLVKNRPPLHIFKQTLSEAFIPVIAYIANSMFYPDGSLVSEVPKGYSQKDVVHFFGTLNFEEILNPADRALHHNILRFIHRKIIPKIHKVVDEVMFMESLSPRTRISSYSLPREVWNFIFQEVLPEYVKAVKLIEVEYGYENDENEAYLPWPMDDARRLEGVYVKHGRRGWWSKFVEWLDREVFTPIVDFLFVDDNDIKIEAIEKAAMKLEADKIKKEKELHDAIKAKEKTKINADIETLINKIEILHLETAPKDEVQSKQNGIRGKMSDKEIKKIKIDLMENVRKELDAIMKERKEAANTTPSV